MKKDPFLEKIQLQKRLKMAEEICKKVNLSPEVKEAIIKTKRELFVPKGFSHFAYKLDALPLSSKQWISSPLTVAKMTETLKPQGADSVLEIGCGSGYQAAVLSQLIRRVFTIERIEKLLMEARKRFREYKITNIHTRLGDGMIGWKEFAPYDRIIISASLDEIPSALFEQLAENGILVAPINRGKDQVITRFYKKNGRITKEEIDSCSFVPIKNGVEK